MSRILIGGLMILFFLVVNSVTAYITTQTTDFVNIPGCQENENLTQCQGASEDTFTEAIIHTAINGVPGAPDEFNSFWVLIGAFLLTLGVIIFAAGILGALFGA